VSKVPDSCEAVPVEDDPRSFVDALVGLGLTRIVCEGGPRLLRDLVAADLVDEADITVSPTFTGTAHSPETESLPDVSHFELHHVLTEDGFLMGRYLRAKAQR
jgi:riboflavin biosynthesis pyrimidine reductase